MSTTDRFSEMFKSEKVDWPPENLAAVPSATPKLQAGQPMTLEDIQRESGIPDLTWEEFEKVTGKKPQAQKPPDKFTTALSPAEESTFQAWKTKYAHPLDSGEDYDLRGAFKAGLRPDKDGHWPDTFKKPNHPTFSVESIYAKDAPGKAGRWEGEKYIPAGTDPKVQQLSQAREYATQKRGELDKLIDETGAAAKGGRLEAYKRIQKTGKPEIVAGAGPSVDPAMDRLDIAKRFLDRAIAMEPGKTGPIEGVIGGLARRLKEPSQLVPFLGAGLEADELRQVTLAAKKEENGESLSKDESALLDAFAAYSSARESFDPGIWDDAAGIAAGVPAFMLEFGGAGEGAGRLAAVGIKKLLSQSARKRLLGKAAIGLARGAATGAALPSVEQEFYTRMAPWVGLRDVPGSDELVRSIDRTKRTGGGAAEGFAEAAAKAYGLSAIEAISEHTGGAVEWATDKVKKKFLSRWLAQKGVTKLDAAAKRMAEKVGWNGILGELFEEQVAKPFRSAIEGTPLAPEYSIDRLATEALGFGIFGGAARMAKAGLNVGQSRKEPVPRGTAEAPAAGAPAPNAYWQSLSDEQLGRELADSKRELAKTKKTDPSYGVTGQFVAMAEAEKARRKTAAAAPVEAPPSHTITVEPTPGEVVPEPVSTGGQATEAATTPPDLEEPEWAVSLVDRIQAEAKRTAREKSRADALRAQELTEKSRTGLTSEERAELDDLGAEGYAPQPGSFTQSPTTAAVVPGEPPARPDTEEERQAAYRKWLEERDVKYPVVDPADMSPEEGAVYQKWLADRAALTPPERLAPSADQARLDQWLERKAAGVPDDLEAPAQTAAERRQVLLRRYQELKRQPKPRTNQVERRASARPPETGLDEGTARAVTEREQLAQELVGKPWTDLTNPERNAIDELRAEGYAGQPAGRAEAPPAPLEPPVETIPPSQDQPVDQFHMTEPLPVLDDQENGLQRHNIEIIQEVNEAEAKNDPVAVAAAETELKENQEEIRKVHDLKRETMDVTEVRAPLDLPGMVVGDRTTVDTPGRPFEATYALIPRALVRASHDPMSFRWNDGYASFPEGTKRNDLQPRNYEGNDAAKRGFETEPFKPNNVLNNSERIQNGPVVVYWNPKDGVFDAVTNGRKIRQDREYIQGRGKESIVEPLRAAAGNFGIDASKINPADEPILVRVLNVSPGIREEVQALGRESNFGTTRTSEDFEKATALGPVVSRETLKWVSENLPGEDGTLRELMADPHLAGQLIEKLKEDGAGNEEYWAGYRGRNNEGLSDSGKNFVETVLLGKVVSDPAALLYTTDAARNKIGASLTPLATMQAIGGQWDITPSINEALSLLGKKRDLGNSIDDLTQQEGLSGIKEREIAHPVSIALAKFLDRKLNGNRITSNAFRDYIGEATQPSLVRGVMAPWAAFNEYFVSKRDTDITEEQWNQKAPNPDEIRPQTVPPPLDLPTEPVLMDAKTLRAKLAQFFPTVTEEQRDAVMSIIEARAAAAGMDTDQWISKRIADIQKGPGKPSRTTIQRASTEWLNDGRVIIRALEKPNVSSLVHELAHVFRKELSAGELAILEKWAGVTETSGWGRDQEETFARGFEKYSATGKSPSEKLRKIFSKFQGWLTAIYKGVKDSPLKIKIPANVSGVFDRMLSTPEDLEQVADVATSGGPKAWGTRNTGVSKAEADKAAKELNDILGGSVFTGLPPEALAKLAKMGAFHIEAGAREIQDFSAKLLADLGEAVREKILPYIEQIYDAAMKHGYGLAKNDEQRRMFTRPTGGSYGSNVPPQLEAPPGARTQPQGAGTGKAGGPAKASATGKVDTGQNQGAAGGVGTGIRQREGARPGKSGGRGLSAKERALATAKPIQMDRPYLEPLPGIYNEKEWAATLERYHLPAGAPVPSVRLSDAIREKLIFPGQKEVGDAILSGLQNHSAYLLAGSTGSGKTFEAAAVLAEMNPEFGLIVAPSQPILKKHIAVGKIFGLDVKKYPKGKNPTEPGIYVISNASARERQDIEKVPWDISVFDESDVARNWNQSKTGTNVMDIAKGSTKVLFVSATPFQGPLDLKYMEKLGLWRDMGWKDFAGQFGVHQDAQGNWTNPANPVKLAKLRQQLIERGQMINQDRNMDGYCYSSDTEILTKRGWSLFSDLLPSDEVATRSPGGEFEWEKPTEFHRYEHGGEMVHFNTKGMDMLVTPNHRMLARRASQWEKSKKRIGYGPERIVLAKDLVGQKHFVVPVTSRWIGTGDGIPATLRKCAPEDLAAFLGIYFAEGSYSIDHKDGKKQKPRPRVAISQADNSGHLADIKNLLDKLPWKFSRYGHDFVSSDRELTEALSMMGNKYTKKMPIWVKDLPAPLLAILLEWAIKGDGTLDATSSGRKRRSVFTVSPALAGDYQELFQKIGCYASAIPKASPSLGKPRFIKGRQIHQRAVLYSVREGISPHKILKGRKVEYSGQTYCVTVPNGIVYVRRNGCAAWCGNSAHFGVVPMSKENLDKVRGIVRAYTMAADYYSAKGKAAYARAARANLTSYVKNFIERTRIPQAVDLTKQALAQGNTVIIFTLNKAEKDPDVPADYLNEANDAFGGEIGRLLPGFPPVVETLQKEFGDQFANYSGSHSAERTGELEKFQNADKRVMYATYDAGGRGVDMHDMVGDRPRVVIYLGMPWSGTVLDQGLGRPWRYGAKSDVNGIFLLSDTNAELSLLVRKIAPRLFSMKAGVSGVDIDDPVVDRFENINDSMADELGMQFKVPASYFHETVPLGRAVQNWKEIIIPNAEQSKHRGMKFWGEEEAAPAQMEPPPEETVRLYRGEPVPGGGGGVPEWVKDSEAFKAMQGAAGRWFTTDIEEAKKYAEESPGENRVTFIDIPKSEAEKYKAANDPEASKFVHHTKRELLNDEHFLPREMASQAKPVSTNLQVGDRVSVMSVPSVLDQTHTSENGVRYELFKGEDSPKTAVKAIDVESGETYELLQYPTYEAARAKFDEAVKGDPAGVLYQRSRRPPADLGPLLPGMESAVEEQKVAAAQKRGEDMTLQFGQAKGDVSAKTGNMERSSPLFGGNEDVQGQKSMFGKESEASTPPDLEPIRDTLFQENPRQEREDDEIGEINQRTRDKVAETAPDPAIGATMKEEINPAQKRQVVEREWAARGLPGDAPEWFANQIFPPSDIHGARELPKVGQATVSDDDLAFPKFARWVAGKGFPKLGHTIAYGTPTGKHSGPYNPKSRVSSWFYSEEALRFFFARRGTTPYVLASTRDPSAIKMLGEILPAEQEKRRETAEILDDIRDDIMKGVSAGSTEDRTVYEALRTAQNPARELAGKIATETGMPFTPAQLQMAQRIRDEVLDPLFVRILEQNPDIRYRHKYITLDRFLTQDIIDIDWGHPEMKGQVPGDIQAKMTPEISEAVSEATLRHSQQVGKDPFNPYVKPREGTPPKNFSTLDALGVYVPAAMKTVHDTPAIRKALVAWVQIPESKPRIKEFGKWYLQNYSGVPGVYPIMDGANRKYQRQIADMHYRALLEWNPQWGLVNLSQSIVNSFPELGQHAAAGAKRLFTDSGRELLVRSGTLSDIPVSGSKFSRGANKAIAVVSSGTEYINRGVAYLGGIEKAKSLGLFGEPESVGEITAKRLAELAEQGVDVSRGLDYAYDAVAKTQFMYTPAYAQRAIQENPLLNIFQSFAFREKELITETLRNAGKSPDGRLKAWRMAMILGGLAASYFALPLISKTLSGKARRDVEELNALLRRAWPFDLFNPMTNPTAQWFADLIRFTNAAKNAVTGTGSPKALGNATRSLTKSTIRVFVPGGNSAMKLLPSGKPALTTEQQELRDMRRQFREEQEQFQMEAPPQF